MLTLARINEVADVVLRATLGPAGYVHADVAHDLDVDGTEAVRVTAHFKAGSKPADGPAALAALTNLRTELQREGEERFPFLRYHFPDDERLSQPGEDARQ